MRPGLFQPVLPALSLVVSDLSPPCSPVSGLWLGVSGPEGRMGQEPPEQPEETRDPSSSAIFWRKGKELGSQLPCHPFSLWMVHPLAGPCRLLTALSVPHHAEEARRETKGTAAPLPAVGQGHREGGHGVAGTRAR